MNGIKDTFWAWLAGFIDGEGYIVLHKSKNPRYKTGIHWLPRIVIANNSKSTLEFIMQTVGKGTIYSMNKSRSHWQLHFTSAQLRESVLSNILPYLVTKHREAELLQDACNIISKRTRSSTLTELRLETIQGEILQCRK